MTKQAKTKSKDTFADLEPEPESVPILVNNGGAQRIVPHGGMTHGNTINLDRHVIYPGFNRPASTETWSAIRENKALVVWTRVNDVQVFDKVSDIPDVGSAIPTIIKQSSSRKSMEWWLENETRPGVRALLEEKVRQMSSRPKVGERD